MAVAETQLPGFKQISAICGRLDKENPSPLYRQLTDRLAGAIRSGELANAQPLPTQKQLARWLGISQITVRRAMSDLMTAGLIQTTRGSGTVVIHRSEEPGESQRTPGAGGALRIGVVYASITDGYPFMLPMLASMEQDGKNESAAPIIQTHYLDPLETNPQVIRHRLPLDDLDGLVLMSPVNTTALSVCQRGGIPYVLLFNDLSDVGSTCITCHYTPGVYQAIAHWSRLGFRRPALITAGEIRYSTGQLVDAMTFACRMHDVPFSPDMILHADYVSQRSYQATGQLLQRADRPNLLFYASIRQAQAGLLAAQELGISVPDQLAIVATGAWHEGISTFRHLSLIDLGLADMGHLAIEFIRRWKTGTASVARRTSIPCRFIADATAPVVALEPPVPFLTKVHP